MKVNSILVLDENKLIINVEEATSREFHELSEALRTAAPGWSVLLIPGDPAIFRVTERPDLEERAEEMLALIRDIVEQQDAPEPAL